MPLNRLPAAVLLSILALVLAMAWATLHVTRQSQDEHMIQRLDSARAHLATRVAGLFEDYAEDVAVRATSGEPAQGIEVLGDLLLATTREQREAIRQSLLATTPDGSDYQAAFDRLMPYFTAAQAEHDYYDVFLIGITGDVLLTRARERDLLANVLTGDLAGSGLSRAFAAATKLAPNQSVMVDFAPYAPSGNEAAAFIAAPVFDAQGTIVGVYAAQIPATLPAMVPVDRPAEGEAQAVLFGTDLTPRLGTMPDQLPIWDQAAQDAVKAASTGQKSILYARSDRTGGLAATAISPIDFLGLRWISAVSLPTKGLGAHLMTAALPLVIALLGGAGLAVGLYLALRQPLRGLTDLAADRDVAAYAQGTGPLGTIARALLAEKDRPQTAPDGGMPPFVTEVIDLIPDPVLLLDADRQVTAVNRALREDDKKARATLAKAWPAAAGQGLPGLTCPAEVMDSGVWLQGDGTGLLALPGDDDTRAAEVFTAIRASHILFELDATARILDANDAAAAAYGYEIAELRGMPLAELMQDGGQCLPALLVRLTERGCLTERHHRKHKTGREIWVDCTLTAVFDKERRIDRILAICHDVTAEVQEAASARRSEEGARLEQEGVVETLGTALRKLAEGDLTVRIDTAFPQDYDRLRSDFNRAADRLDQAIEGVATGAQTIGDNAAEIAEAAEDLSRRTENQAATLEQTAAALDVLTNIVTSAARDADEADRTVESARVQAESSGGVVVDAVSAMSEIENSSRQIRQIIGVIDDIAFQTNLLALNAGVEAARAGDAGRGFAVVASEVRALAQRSSDAAKEIKELISASSRHVERGVGLVGQTGDALKSIIGSVADIAARVNAIARAAKEQASSLSEINAGIANMDEVTQQNAAMVEESTAASHSLRDEAKALTALVAPLRGSPRQAVKAKATRAVPAAPAPAVGRGGVAFSKAPLRSAAGWEEF